MAAIGAPEQSRTVGRLRDIRALIAATGVSAVGDGAFVAAAPLLAAALTHDPAAVGAVSAATYLPWLVITPFAGALVDRWNLRSVLVIADFIRALGLALLAALVVTHLASIPILATIACAIVVGQIFGDTASQTVVVDLAGRESNVLNKANGRISSVTTGGNSFAGPPVGSALFAIAPWLPFALDGLSFIASGSIMATLPRGRPATSKEERPHLLRAMASGAAFLARHAELRALCLLTAAANLTTFMALATFVLYARHDLGVSTAAYGVVLAVGSLGGVAGGLVASKVISKIGARASLVLGLSLQAICWPAIGLIHSPHLACVCLAIAEFSSVIGTVVAVTARQQFTPPEMLGRVISAFRTVGAGAAPLGALIGGVLASAFTLRVPLFAAGAVLAAVLISALPTLRRIKPAET